MAWRGLQGVRNVVVGVFAVALLLGLFLPVYTDEIGWRFQERAAIDGVDKLYSDGCGANTLAAPPFFMMPVRFFSAVFNTALANPLTVRLSGVGYALAWLALLLLLIRRIAADARDRALVTVCGVALMCLGTLPLLLVWSRPEQPILIAVLAALLVAWSDGHAPRGPTSPRSAWLRSAAIVLLAVVALSYHLKGVLLFPIFAVCLVFASRGRAAVWPRLASGAVLAGLTGWAARYWSQRMQCPDDALLWAKFSRNSIGAELSGISEPSQLPALVVKLVGNIDLVDYVRLPAPRPAPLSTWLESGQITRGHSALWADGLVVLWAAAALLALACLALTAWSMVRERRIDRRWVMALALLATATGWAGLQTIKNVYEACLMLPLLMLAIVFALASQDGALWQRRILAWPGRGLAAVLALAAVASPVAIGIVYGPSLARAAERPGYVAKQRWSLSTRPYPGLEREVLKAAGLCGIPAPEHAQALMIDDLTYLAFMESRLPQHWLGVIGQWKGEITDPIAYLESRGSDGVIVGCHILPPDLRGRAKRSGAFCCLAPPNW